jgi:hypothetical protein
LASSRQVPKLDPASLASALDTWALRREKILELLDVRASRTARKLAQQCRALSAAASDRGEDAGWQAEWLALRERARTILENAAPGADRRSARSSEEHPRATEAQSPMPASARAKSVRPGAVDPSRADTVPTGKKTA